MDHEVVAKIMVKALKLSIVSSTIVGLVFYFTVGLMSYIYIGIIVGAVIFIKDFENIKKTIISFHPDYQDSPPTNTTIVLASVPVFILNTITWPYAIITDIRLAFMKESNENS